MDAETSTLEELLRPESRELEIGGNRPLGLDAEDKVWLVLAGMVEIFAAAPRGGRTHLATAKAGELLLSLEPRTSFARAAASPGRSTSLLAVAHPGTRFLETSAAALTRLAREPRHAHSLEAAIEGWVRGLFRQVPRKDAPRHFVELDPGAEARLEEEGGVGRTVSGTVWVRHVQGRSRFLGREELTLEPSDSLFPISEETWLVGTGDCLLSCVATGHLLKSGTLWEGLRGFHEVFLRYVALQSEARDQEERQRAARRLELDRDTVRSALGQLASVLGGDSRHPPARQEGAAPLYMACRLVAEHQGIALRPTPVPTSSADGASAAGGVGPEIRRICEASRVRQRRVLLRDDWWRRDNGALVAFLKEDGDETSKTSRPVALLPVTPTTYDMVDPASSTRAPVDEAVAESLASDAYMLYPVLPERQTGARTLLRLAFRDRRRDLLMLALMGLGGGLLSVLVPVVTEQLYGRVIPGADRSQLLQMTLALAFAALGAAAFQVTRSIAVLRLTGKIDGSVQAALWDRLLGLPSAFFRRFTVGDLTSRAMGLDAIRGLLLGNVTTSFLGLVFSVFSFALLFYYSIALALLASALILILVVATALMAYLQLRYQRALLAVEGRISSLVFGLIRGIAKLRTGGAEARAYGLWAERFSEQRRLAFRVQGLANVQAVFNVIYGVFATLALFAVMGLALESGLSVSRFLAFSAAFGQVQAASLAFASLISGVLSIVPIFERLSPILEEVPEVGETKIAASELSGDIELSHVSFRYHDDGPLVLNDISMRAGPGEFVALVGPSGSGKSTCLRLLLGFERPLSGSIYYDGQDLASLDPQSVRRQIGVVLQNSRPMSGDIFTNIVGASNLGIDAAWEAVRMVGLEDDIRAMPMGMHTVVSEGAGTFSGGQVQRLMIARAIIHRPRLIFFDEATSALDNRTQNIVSRSLERLKATRIVIAHRLSTIRNADRVYVIESGRVRDGGTYDELAARDKLFAHLIQRQVV